MKSILMVLVLASAASATHAATFDFSYTRGFDNKSITGQLVGTLQPDGNTVLVTSVLDFVSLDGVAGSALPYVYSTDAINFGSIGSPKVSLNGAFMDFLACNAIGCSGGFDTINFSAGNLSAATFGTNGAPFYASDGSYGAFSEKFDSNRWTMSAIPEPGTLAMLALGGGLLISLRRVAARRPKTDVKGLGSL